MTTPEFARDGTAVYKLPGLDAWYPQPIKKDSAMSTRSSTDLQKRLVDGVGNPIDHALSARKGTVASDEEVRRKTRIPAEAEYNFPNEGAEAARSEHDYTPGMTVAMDDDELAQITSRGKPAIPPDPVPQHIYEQRALFDEAVQQKNRRWAIANARPDSSALRDPTRSAVQMQTALDPAKTPTMRPAATAASAMKPIQAMSDAELEAVVDMSRTQRASPDAPVSETTEKAARSEMFKRAGRGTPISLFGESGLTGWR